MGEVPGAQHAKLDSVRRHEPAHPHAHARFAAQFSTSCIIVIASGLGLPVSTTQTMVGAILGVGLARGLMALNMRVIKGIFISWLITLPAGALLAAGYFLALQQLLVK